MLQIHFALREKQRCLLCVDGKDASDFQGRLYHMLLMEPKGIVGIGQFLLEMEEIFKRAGRPAASTQNRVLSGKSKNSGRPEKKK